MPSFHLKKRLNKLRGNPSRSESLDEPTTGNPDTEEPPHKSNPDQPGVPAEPSRWRNPSLVPSVTTSSSTLSIRSKSPSGLTDPLGLHIIYSPDDGIKADIVFIHGLGGTSRMTWSKDKNIRLFWPGEFLPLENGICQARISTFGYNADIKSGSRTSSSILDFAKDLLYDLKYAQGDETKGLGIGQVPLIFVAHSMGGLIVKEAYLQGQYDPEYSDIVKAVSAILFLSTPHRGTNLADTLNRILQVSPLSTPKHYIAELAQNSFTVQKLNEQFRHIAPKLNIISFYETLPTAIAGRGSGRIMVLEKDSSVLGYPGEVSKALDADHHTVCKYDSPQDPKYLAVCSYLKSKIDTIFAQQPRQVSSKLSVVSSQASAVPPLKTRDLEDIFAITEPADADYIFFRDRWTPGTCEWIQKHERFSDWLDVSGQSSPLLWIHGRPGSGKSILSSYVIDHLVQTGHSCQYFFVRHGDARKRSLSSLLRSLAFQTTQADPLFLGAIARVSANLALRGADPRTIWQRIFRSILFTQDRSTPLFWVIDGFDECDDIRTGIKFLTEILGMHQLGIKILLTSRWNAEMEASLKKLSPDTHPISVIDMQDNGDDCQTFIQHELDWGHIPEFQDRISKQLLDQAEGSFLWTRLTVDRINRCHTAAAVEQALNELHPGMEELYHQMAASIADLSPADASLAMRILSWVCCAQRRLTVLELAQALEPESRDIIDLQRSIAALCAGFVVLDSDGSVAMVHQTARDFLVQSKNKVFKVDRKQSHVTIALRCLRSFSTPGLRRKVRSDQAPIFLGYATNYLWAHLASCNPLPNNLIDAFAKFIRGPDVFTWIQFLGQDEQLHVLVQASDYMSICAGRVNTPERISDQLLLNGWAVDLGKLVGKFGRQLLRHPESIHTSIAPFCPINSMVHKQLAHMGQQDISVTGIGKDWDDSVARLSFPPEYEALTIVSGGQVVAVAGMLDRAGKIVIYRVDTHEEVQQLDHGERIRQIQIDQFGTMLVSCGYSTTIVWSLETGEYISKARNPPTRPYPQTVMFHKDQRSIIIGTNDRRLWTIDINPSLEASYNEVTRILEQRGGTNSPTCMALSPDGQLLALGYRQQGISIWDLESHEPVASRPDLTRATRLVWHPHNGELFGLLQDLSGRIFKWYPDEFEEPLTQYAEASNLAISDNGSVLAVGDQHGNVRLMSTEDLAIIYQVAAQDPVLAVTFSSDCRQLYDLRRTHANVWQPDVLVRLAEPAPELSDLDSDSDKTIVVEPVTPSFTKQPIAEMVSARVDPITALAASLTVSGTFYCAGTLAGVVQLYEARSRLPILELHRSKNFFSIQQISWSHDGTMVCYADVGRTIRVDAIGGQNVENGAPSARRLVDLTAHDLKDNITQVLFSPDGSRLFVSSMTTSVVVNISDQTILSVVTNANEATLERASLGRWCHHPWSGDMLISANDTAIQVFEWASLARVSSTTLQHGDTPHNRDATTPSQPPSPIPGSIRRSETLSPQDGNAPPEVLVSPSGKYLLTFRSQSTRSVATLKLWKLLDRREKSTSQPEPSSPSSTTATSTDTANLAATEISIPPELLDCIARPLGFLAQRVDGTTTSERLVFLDADAWICTWTVLDRSSLADSLKGKQRATTSRNALRLSPTQFRNRAAPGGSASSTYGSEHSSTNSEIKMHYSVPSDWVCPDTVRLFRLFGNGMLACPTDGRVIVVECKGLLTGKGPG